MPVRVVESSAPSPAPEQEENPDHALLPACTLLGVGQTFAGTQNVSSSQKDEAWKVNVRIHGFDLDHGYLCGIMEALNVPYAETPVVTFWEGEIIDGKNFTFYTGKWEATHSLLQRWKEQYFVNVSVDCGLTIAGFYYVCFSCIDGSVDGFYYDPNSSPFQKLELKSANEGRPGFSSSSYQLQ